MHSPQQFTPDELREFLVAVDAHLHRRATITIVGGGAIVLAYGVDRDTKDIDTLETDLSAIQQAVQQAREETGLYVPISGRARGVAALPFNYESRLVRVMPELHHLIILSLDKHDLALSKAMRGWANDMEAVFDLYNQCGLDRDVLAERFVNEMRAGECIGHPRDTDTKFKLLLDMLGMLHD